MAKSNFNVGFVFGAKKSGSFDKTFKAVDASIGGIVKGIAGIAATYVGAETLTNVAKTAVASAQGLEGYRNTLNIVLKDTEKAAQAMTWAVDFANKTPFETESIVEATVRLESYGLKAQSILPQIGDMAGVMNKDIMQAVEAVADAQTGELERMKEFGITKAMIAEKANKMFADTEIINAKGQIADQTKFNEALFALMNDRFKGGMDMQSKTLSGGMSTIKGIWKTGLASMAGMSKSGEVIKGGAFDVIKDSVSQLAAGLQEFSANGGFEAIGVTVGKIAGFAGKGVTAVGKLVTTFNELGFAGGMEKLFGADTADKVINALGIIKDIGSYIVTNWQTLLPIVGGVGIAYGAIRAGTFAVGVVKDTKELVKFTVAMWGNIKAKSADKIMSLQIVGLYAKDMLVALGKNTAALALSAGKWVANTAVMLAHKAASVGVTVATKAMAAGQWALNAAVSGGKWAASTAAMLAHKAVSVGATVATKAMAAGQWLLNAAMAANPIGIVVIAVAALVAGFVLLWNNCEGFRNFFIGMWEGIKGAVSVAVDWIIGAWDGIKTAFSSIGEWFSGLWDGIVAGFKGYINFIISGVNLMIRGINKLQVTVPDWVPLLGGETIGFSIPEIPMLAQGGIATSPTLAMIGEGKENEAVLPLSKLDSMLAPSATSRTSISIAPLVELLKRFLSAVSAPQERFEVTFAPVINIQGNGDPQAISDAIQEEYQRFKQFLERYERDKKRMAFSV